MYARRHYNLNDSACHGSKEATASHLVVLIAPQWRRAFHMDDKGGSLTAPAISFPQSNMTGFSQLQREASRSLNRNGSFRFLGVVAVVVIHFGTRQVGFASYQSKKVCSRTASREAACWEGRAGLRPQRRPLPDTEGLSLPSCCRGLGHDYPERAQIAPSTPGPAL